MVRHLPNSAVNAHYLLAIRSRLCLAVAWLLVLSNLATAQTKPSSFKPSPTDKTTNKTAKTATTNKKPNPNSSTTAITASNITAPNMRAVEGENQRFVHVPKATVRCGPGTDYYPTGLLSKGTSVEVYVETDDGWSGIRPPKGSHNWVQADALYLLPGGRVGEVAVDTTPAWIGSDASKNEKLLYQTDLVKSQTVAIQGEAYRGQDDEKKLWFRIAPPQGEFRWVKTSMLGKDPVPPESKELTSTSNKDPKSVSTANYLAPQGKGAKPAVRTTSQMEPQDPIEASEAPPSKGKLAWSDEAEQTERVSQEIRREQQKIEQEIRASGLPSKAKSSLLAKTPRQAPSANFDGASVKPTAKPSANSTARSRSRPAASPGTEQPIPQMEQHPKSQWQFIQQRPVGPEETDSMNHILGMFGLSLVDPQNIEGHPNQYKPRAPVQNHPNYVMRDNVASPHQNNLHSNNPFSQQRMFAPSGSVAGIEHLPRPSGRYAQRRYDSPSTLPLGNDYRSDLMDRDYRNTAANPPLAPNNSVSPSGIATASFARDSSNLNDYSSSDWNSRNPSPSSAGQEVERFQTPQIQDALVQLSVIVSRPSEQWNLAPLRDSAMMWIERGETPLIRGEARLLLDRIERFEAVRQRSSASPLTPPSNYSEGIPLRSPASDSEMSGWLVAVHTSLPGQPEFALTDDLGNVKAYVRPTTGLNLRRYVQQPVTVFGPQGYLPNLGAKQVVADRVVRLR